MLFPLTATNKPKPSWAQCGNRPNYRRVSNDRHLRALEAIRTFGFTYLRPPGVPSTMRTLLIEQGTQNDSALGYQTESFQEPPVNLPDASGVSEEWRNEASDGSMHLERIDSHEWVSLDDSYDESAFLQQGILPVDGSQSQIRAVSFGFDVPRRQSSRSWD